MWADWDEYAGALHARYRQIGKEIAAARTHADEGFDHAGWDRLGKEGLWQLAVPGAPGRDAGAGWWQFTAALDGLAQGIRTPALLLSIIAQAGMIRAFAHYGTDAQKARYFDKLLRGELSATAIAEPTTGTDVRSIGTTLTPDGDGFRLDGRKYNIAHAPVADFTLVVCKLQGTGKDGVTLVVIDRDVPGVTLSAPDDKLGNRDLPTGGITFTQTPVRRDQILGTPGKGLQQLIDIISLGRLYYGMVSASLLEPYVGDAIDYAQQRESFREPIAEHQYVQRRLVDVRVGIERTRWLAMAALGRLLQRSPDAVMLCSIAKLVGADDLITSALSLLRLQGSRGYHEGPLAILARDVLGFASVGGTEEMHRKNIYNQMVRLHAQASR